MPLIPNLPAAGSLSASDLLIKDTGSTTQKLLVSNAYASETAPGFVSTGAQTFAGAKTFQSNTITINGAIAYPGLLFYSQNQSGTERLGGLRFNFGATTPTQARGYIEEASFSGTAHTGYYETFYLPPADAGRTANASYNILTTKDYVINEVKRFSIPANGSLTITFSGDTRGLAVFSSYTASTKGLCVLCSSSTAASYKLIGDPTSISVTASGTSITFTNSYSYNVLLEVFMFLGNVSG